MFPPKLYLLLYAFKILTCSCQSERKTQEFLEKSEGFSIHKIGEMPKAVNESSGLETYKDSNLYLTHNDSGGNPELYLIDLEGNIRETLPIEGSQNKDWEDITQDKNGTIFIGDFGNNSMARKDLLIYKWDGKHTETIRFQYENQLEFPAKQPVFDCEAFFWANDSLYLFTKSYFKKKQKQRSMYYPTKQGITS